MEWYFFILIFLGTLALLLLIGVPIAFAFFLLVLIWGGILMGGTTGLVQVIHSIFENVAKFALLPLPLFILMGSVMFHSGIAPRIIDAVDMWLGRLPGRLGLVAVATGTLLGTLTGASHATNAILGSMLTPEMESRGYKKTMSLGPILGSGGLAIMIPPSSLAVFIGALAEISIGRILMGIIVPGLLMAFLYATYIVVRCWLQPSIAPSYAVTLPPLSHRLFIFAKHILPLGFVVFLVTGVIVLGIATPTEAASTGALGVFLLVAAYGKLTWKVIKDSFWGTIKISVMVFTIIAAARTFAQLLGFSGASRGLAEFVGTLPVDPVVIVIVIQLFGILLGMFMTPTGLLSIIVPLFLPVLIALKIDLVWFAVIMLLTSEMAPTSPPFGNSLFVMKGVAPPDTTMGQIYRAALPFLGCDLVAMAIIIAIPQIPLWLPSLMRGG
jgi:tripartite ATP-independent transporter DctM subunit